MPLTSYSTAQDDRMCKHCGGSKDIANPTGRCVHIYWPDNLTDEARLANGIPLPVETVFERLRLKVTLFTLELHNLAGETPGEPRIKEIADALTMALAEAKR